MKRMMTIVLRLTAIGLALATLGPAIASRDEDTRIRSVRLVGDDVEIEVTSEREFPVRAQMTVLRIGDQEFVRSRYPKDGRHDTLIFTLSRERFDALAAGLPVIVQYGRGRVENPRSRWEAGTLDKRLIDRRRPRRERRRR